MNHEVTYSLKLHEVRTPGTQKNNTHLTNAYRPPFPDQNGISLTKYALEDEYNPLVVMHSRKIHAR